MDKKLLERIEAIRNAAEKIRQDKENAQNAELNRRKAVLKGLQDEYSRRIADLVTLGKELVANGIQLGESIPDHIGARPEFVTEGIHHKLGFIAKCNGSVCWNKVLDVIGIGIEGGGADAEDFFFDEFGTFTKYTEYVYNVQCHNFDDKVKRFKNEFDNFERRVMDYIDSLGI